MTGEDVRRRRMPPRLARALGLGLALAGAASSRVHAQVQAPDARYRVQIWGEVSAEFSNRVRSYAAVRDEAERGLPPRAVTDDAAAILARTQALAARIRELRAQARPGDIFTPEVSTEFRKALAPQLDSSTCAAIEDENPGAMTLAINGSYPTHQPLSTMPPNVIATLPRLPEDVEYRIVGRELILFDTRAGLVIDRMSSAVLCRKER